MSTHHLTSDRDRDLQARLTAAAGDVSAVTAIVSRATAQGQRSLRRRRAAWTVSAGTGVAALATGVVTGVLSTDSMSEPIAPAGPGMVRTVPDQRPVPRADTTFTVDPQVQQATSQAINTAVTAAVPGLPPAQAEPTSVLNVPLSTGQRGWVWATPDTTTTPSTGLFLTVYQYRTQPTPVVSVCERQDVIACTEEVLPDGSHLVSGFNRSTFDQDGVEAEVTLPYATITHPDGQEISASATIGGLPQEGTTYPSGARISVASLRAVVTADSLSDLTLPTSLR